MTMYLHGIASALPAPSYTQRECWDIMSATGAVERLRPRSAHLLEKVLLGESGIARRHFAVEPVESILDLDAEALNRAFEREAPALAARAVERALAQAGWHARELDCLVVCTCTGYLCPGLSSYVAERLGLAPSVYLQDLVGLGCGAAIPALRSAAGLVAAEPGARVACVAVEVCSAAFYVDDDPGVLISLCLFGDGACATLWSDTPGASGLRCGGFQTLHLPEDRELLRFENRRGRLRNRLHRTVPEKAAAAVKRLFGEVEAGTVEQVVAHAGGRDVLAAVEAVLPGRRLDPTASVLRDCGNMSSPSVLFALERYLEVRQPQRDLWLTSFGAGFACHACRLGPSN